MTQIKKKANSSVAQNEVNEIKKFKMELEMNASTLIDVYVEAFDEEHAKKILLNKDNDSEIDKRLKKELVYGIKQIPANNTIWRFNPRNSKTQIGEVSISEYDQAKSGIEDNHYTFKSQQFTSNVKKLKKSCSKT
jgi:hypothetical protein